MRALERDDPALGKGLLRGERQVQRLDSTVGVEQLWGCFAGDAVDEAAQFDFVRIAAAQIDRPRRRSAFGDREGDLGRAVAEDLLQLEHRRLEQGAEADGKGRTRRYQSAGSDGGAAAVGIVEQRSDLACTGCRHARWLTEQPVGEVEIE